MKKKRLAPKQKFKGETPNLTTIKEFRYSCTKGFTGDTYCLILENSTVHEIKTAMRDLKLQYFDYL